MVPTGSFSSTSIRDSGDCADNRVISAPGDVSQAVPAAAAAPRNRLLFVPYFGPCMGSFSSVIELGVRDVEVDDRGRRHRISSVSERLYTQCRPLSSLTPSDWLSVAELGLYNEVSDSANKEHAMDRKGIDRKSTRLNSSHLGIS